MPLSDTLRFFGAWLTAPLRVASLTPSGAGLSRLITSEISAATGPVLELGPGTGVFTQALLDRGVAEQDLSLVELRANTVDRGRAAAGRSAAGGVLPASHSGGCRRHTCRCASDAR